MHVTNLGPHSFSSPPHEHHHAWLTQFSPKQRHQLIEEDLEARTGATMVLAGGMLFGMTISLVTVITSYFLGLL